MQIEKEYKKNTSTLKKKIEFHDKRLLEQAKERSHHSRSTNQTQFGELYASITLVQQEIEDLREDLKASIDKMKQSSTSGLSTFQW